jgi:hypothetical protein
MGPLLFHCDTDWNVLGVSGAPTVGETKERAERNYPGVHGRWIDLNTSIEDALQFYDGQGGCFKCSFCGKRQFELEGRWFEGNEAIICEDCVGNFYSFLGHA